MTTSSFTSEADRVADRIRQQIIDGERAEGSRLVERDLAAELGVSRVPVREALRILIGEGLATPHPRTFTTVRRFTTEDVEELIEVRSALETLAVRLATQHRHPAALRRLEELVEEAETALDRSDPAASRRSGAAFHDQLVGCAGNALLAELFAVIDARMRWLLAQHDDPAVMAREHRAVYEAIAAGDAERSVERAREHLATSRRTAIARRDQSRAAPAARE